MINSLSDLLKESINQDPNVVDEMGVKSPERLTGSSMGTIRRSTIARQGELARRPQTRTYNEIAVDLIRELRSIRRLDITMTTPGGTRDYYPKFPEEIVNLMREAQRADQNRFLAEFGRWSDLYGDNDSSIHFRTDGPSSNQRSHFPNDGIPSSLRGLGLGYKLYRTLLKYAGYISSNTSGTSEKDKAWGSLLAYKNNPDGTPSEDDAHAIIGPSNWMALDKAIPNRTKVEVAERFIRDTIGLSNTTPDRFDIDDELLELLPDEFLSELTLTYLTSLKADGRISQEKFNRIESSRGEAERREAERAQRAEAEARERQREADEANVRRYADKIRRFGAVPDEDWNIGDFIVVKDYLYRDYEDLPIRKVEGRNGQNYIAVYIRDAIRIENGTLRLSDAGDTRTTSIKANWVKIDINRIPDLSNVNLQPSERTYIENLLRPEVRTAHDEEERTRETAAREETVRANRPRSENPETYGFVPSSGNELKTAINNRHYSRTAQSEILKAFKSQRFLSSLSFIVLGPTQRSIMRHSWAIPVYIPWGRPGGRRGFPTPIRSIDELLTFQEGVHLTNAVTGEEIAPPFSGLDLFAYPLAEVTVADKLAARNHEFFYIAGHQNVYGVIAKSDYGAVNTSRQKFIYLDVYGFGNRSVSVRLDLLRKLGQPIAI